MSDETQEFQNQVHVAAFNELSRLIDSGVRPNKKCKFKTAKIAMEVFEKEFNRDHHGNAFKEYFGDTPIWEVPDGVEQFIEWLLAKYNRNESTIAKKTFAASAMFRWLIKTKQWNGVNPFHGALSDIKFAPRRRLKSVIEKFEYDKINAIMRDEKFKELRISIALMYYCGLRPSETLNIDAKHIDPERLTLLYLRTKRKNKPPDWRRIPIPSQLIVFLTNEGRTDGKLVRVGKTGLEMQMRKVSKAAEIGGLTLKTWRKDYSCRARLAGASKDDLNLYQGRDESVLEHHYTTDEWYIVHQCRPWIERMFSEQQGIVRIK